MRHFSRNLQAIVLAAGVFLSLYQVLHRADAGTYFYGTQIVYCAKSDPGIAYVGVFSYDDWNWQVIEAHTEAVFGVPWSLLRCNKWYAAMLSLNGVLKDVMYMIETYCVDLQ